MRSDSGIRFGDLAPSRKGSLARSAAEVSRDGFRIRDVEEVRDLIVNRQKPLCLPGRFESLHDQFASPCRLVRVFRAIVQALVLAMFDAKAHLHPRSAIRTELQLDDTRRQCSKESSFFGVRSTIQIEDATDRRNTMMGLPPSRLRRRTVGRDREAEQGPAAIAPGSREAVLNEARDSIRQARTVQLGKSPVIRSTAEPSAAI